MKPFDIKTQRQLLEGLSEPITFVHSYNKVVESLNLLGSKYGIDISKCIMVRKEKHGTTFTILEPINMVEPANIPVLVKEIWVILYNNGIFPLQFLFMETKPNEIYKFIDENCFKDNDSMCAGPRIIKVLLDNIPLAKPYYQTLEDLVLYDEGYLTLKSKRAAFAMNIALPQNIVNAKNFVIVPAEGDEDNLNYLLLTHTITGNRERRKFTGIHHIEEPRPNFYKDFVVVNPEDEHGVYKATFKIEKEDGRIISKDGPSTMFPNKWSLQQLYLECYQAIKNKQAINGSITEFKSVTPLGVPVLIFYGPNGRFRTIYPEYNELRTRL